MLNIIHNMGWTLLDETSESGNKDDFVSKSQTGKYYENRKY